MQEQAQQGECDTDSQGGIEEGFAVHLVSFGYGLQGGGAFAPVYLSAEVGVTVQTQLDCKCHQGGTICNWANVSADHCAQLTGSARSVTRGGVLFNHLDLAFLLLSHLVSFVTGYKAAFVAVMQS